jgi:hypothetical protein
MPKKVKPVAVPAPLLFEDKAPYWAFFFQRQRSPFLRSQIMTALMAGQPFELDRLPPAVLLDVLMLATACRYYLEAEVIDDYPALLRRVNDVWKDPLFTHRVFDQVHMSTASMLAIHGLEKLEEVEVRYIPSLAEWVLQHDPPTYFLKETV